MDKSFSKHVYIVINLYSKGTWITAAALYKITGHIEHGKTFNFLLIIASFFITLSAFKNFKQINHGKAIILSFLLSFNPVSICQTLSFYVDGQLSSLLVIMASLGYLLFVLNDKLVIINLLGLSIIMIFNVKFTGFVYALVFSAGLLICFFLSNERKINVKILKVYMASCLLGIFLVGYNPYITNTVKCGNPFYPLAGKGALKIIEPNMPANFLAMNRFEKLFTSIFSKSENVQTPRMTEFKLPFTISKSELHAFGIPDVRIGGFGPLFGGAVILASLIIINALPLRVV